MLRNLPEGFSRDQLCELFDRAGFHSQYDFVYIPTNFRTKVSFGYAFVNLRSPEQALAFHDHFQGFEGWGVKTDKICDVSWSDCHQGLSAHIERYRNSPVMHELVPDEYKPAMFDNGVRIGFPLPTKKIRLPRVRRLPSDGAGEEGDDDDDDANGEETGAVEDGAHGAAA